ncbi:phosphotransferase [Sphaerisporangium dianthi]|uniref:Phosphotransferase n=1 Tax=Sphaerisporangium dianthi TaxID=1436120 RepID=A0ABV9CN45_9ACTN
MRMRQLLASGRTADVYALGDGRVLRRYRTGADATTEAAVMTYLAGHGYPVPAVHATPVGAPSDLVLQRLSGPTMLLALINGTISPEEAGATLGRLLHRLHAIPARISSAPGDRVLHLDLHPDNVLLTPDGPFVIDWCNSAEGPPELDWAMSALILAQVVLVPEADPARAETARTALVSLLSTLGDTLDIGDPRTGPLAEAGTRRASDPSLTQEEANLVPSALTLIADSLPHHPRPA